MSEIKNSIVITGYDNKTVSLYLKGETIYDVVTSDPDDSINVGDVYVGRIQSVVNNINAAFIDLTPGKRGYLKLSEKQNKILNPEQEIIVQIIKPAKGDKDPVLSTDIELPGRYAVIKSGDGTVSVSKKIRDEMTIDRLKSLAGRVLGAFDINNINDDNTEIRSQVAEDPSACADRLSVMIRTNAADAPDDAIIEEMKYLCDIMKGILSHGSQRVLYSRLYREPPVYIRHINSYRSDMIDRIITDQPDVYEVLTGKEHGIPVELYSDTSYPLDARFAVSTSIHKASDRRVWLKSGANLIIDRTEAMTVIDVNTAKAIEGKRASRSTFLKINMEAADEIARQLRLRNISGIIIVDFIDMKDKSDNDLLISHMRDLLKEDPVKAMYVDMTALGLMEITRKKQFSDTPLITHL